MRPTMRQPARLVILLATLLLLAGAVSAPGSGADESTRVLSDWSDAREPHGFRDRWVDRGDHRIHVREKQGAGPTIVLMHGFPDNHHLYDELVPHLRGRHVVVFDFLGWGESDKPEDYDYTFANQEGDLDAVIRGLGLDQTVLVPHDASGPAAINWAVDHPDQVDAIVALNTFYGLPPGWTPNPPEAIRIFSDPNFDRLTAAVAESPEMQRWIYEFQMGQFILDDDVEDEFVPLMFRQFEDEPSTIGPFLELNTDLRPTLAADTGRYPDLQSFTAPVLFAFGEQDPYLPPTLAEGLAALFPNGEAATIPDSAHFPQLDNPTETAQFILDA